jgi:GntR family transcriptional repressor for pyruvate dehydrogenase complex
MYKKVIRPKPVYQQVADQIEYSIIHGLLRPGDKLPGERELAEEFDVSRRALREAIKIVEQKGLIETKKGRSLCQRIEPESTQ